MSFKKKHPRLHFPNVDFRRFLTCIYFLREKVLLFFCYLSSPASLSHSATFVVFCVAKGAAIANVLPTVLINRESRDFRLKLPLCGCCLLRLWFYFRFPGCGFGVLAGTAPGSRALRGRGGSRDSALNKNRLSVCWDPAKFLLLDLREKRPQSEQCRWLTLHYHRCSVVIFSRPVSFY